MTAPLSLSADTDDDDVKKELKALQGSWKTVGLEIAGKSLPKDGLLDFTFEIGADGKSKAKAPQDETLAMITVNPKKTPKTIDNLHETGPEKGKKQYGIYKLEGDKLTVCITRAGSDEADRPKEFTSKDSSNVLFVFERVKEDKKP
jgi:uncharacterized protein (TIGR03067 family)